MIVQAFTFYKKAESHLQVQLQDQSNRRTRQRLAKMLALALLSLSVLYDPQRELLDNIAPWKPVSKLTCGGHPNIHA